MHLKADQPTVLLLINDLIFETKICSTARSIGINVAIVRSAVDLDRALGDTSPSLMIIDLNTGGDGLRAVERAHNHVPRPTILAFVSHIDTARFTQAREAGADHVLPRSRFSQELPRLLCELAPAPPDSDG